MEFGQNNAPISLEVIMIKSIQVKKESHCTESRKKIYLDCKEGPKVV